MDELGTSPIASNMTPRDTQNKFQSTPSPLGRHKLRVFQHEKFLNHVFRPFEPPPRISVALIIAMVGFHHRFSHT